MMRKRSFWLVALALAMLLTCTACGKKKAADGDAAPDTKQEQTVDSKTGDTARTEDKKDGTAAGDKTDAKTDPAGGKQVFPQKNRLHHRLDKQVAGRTP